ncbi:MAG: 30S ribosome-binding factor RbfA [Planctomycetota bacterium]|jgi:ribosome-binding factor A
MPTRRQEKVARIVREAVSDAIVHHLSDPRIEGFVSVTRVDMSPDLRTADVYLSIFTSGRGQQKDSKAEADEGNLERDKTFVAITHAKSRIQSLVADRLQSKFCPVLRFHTDEKFKKTLEIMKLIDRTSSELRSKDSVEGEGN